jgi:hypothetical protein
MRKIISVFTFFCFALITSTFADLSDIALITAAQNFLDSKQVYHTNIKHSLKQDYNLILNDNKTAPLAYVFELEPAGFIVFSTLKELNPVVAFSFNSKFNFKESADNKLLNLIRVDLDKKSEAVRDIKEKNIVISNSHKWENLIEKNIYFKSNDVTAVYGPLLKSKWGGSGFENELGESILVGNLFTPYNWPAGCVAVSMSQILHYYKWPENGIGTRSYKDASSGVYVSANFGKTFYNWENMLDIYHQVSSAEEERAAMGELVYHCGVAHGMYYGKSGSTANVKNTPDKLNKYFRYTGHYKVKKDWDEFWNRLRVNIIDGYPVQMVVSATKDGAGHAIVCDGFDNTTDTNYYYLNMGWRGEIDAWYALENEFLAAKYDIVSSAVFDIRPNPVIYKAEQSENNITLFWQVAEKLNWEAFELQQSSNGGNKWITVSDDIVDTEFTVPVSSGEYLFRVSAQSSGHWYLNSYSENFEVSVI